MTTVRDTDLMITRIKCATIFPLLRRRFRHQPPPPLRVGHVFPACTSFFFSRHDYHHTTTGGGGGGDRVCLEIANRPNAVKGRKFEPRTRFESKTDDSDVEIVVFARMPAPTLRTHRKNTAGSRNGSMI